MAEEAVGGQAALESATPVSAQPSVIELSDDSLVKLPGSDKPTKYGEWFRGFQGKHTEATMARAQLAKELKDSQSRFEALQAEANRYRAALEIKPPTRDTRREAMEKLKELPYIKGDEAYGLYESLREEVEGAGQKLQVRDQAIRLLAGELSQMKQLVSQMVHRNSLGDFDTKIAKYRDQLGLPEEATEFLKELYSAYEGENLDEEFPSIAQKRFEQLQGLINAQNKKRVEEARKQRFVPGKGGGATPGKGGPPDTSKMSAKETADVLFDMMQAGEET